MQIHIFIAHMGIGGSERVCVNLANEFARREHEVHVVVLNLQNDVNTHLLDERINVHELGVTRLRYSPFKMLGYIKKYKPGFIFVFGQEMAVILNKLKKLHMTKIPVIVRVLNNTNIKLSKEDEVSPVVENYLKRTQKELNDMSAVIAQCKGMEKMLLEAELVTKDKIKTIYNPVSQPLIDKVFEERKTRTSAKEKEILFIGRVDPQKNLYHLIDAYSKLRDRISDVHLRIVGDGHLMEQMKEYCASRKLSDCVIFDGIRKDMDQVYFNADVVALSSEYEGMPNCLIEAIGCGIPIVSYDCPIGPGEIVVDGVNGYLVEYNNVEQLSDRLVDALMNKWDASVIRKTVDKFLVKEIADIYEKLFMSL